MKRSVECPHCKQATETTANPGKEARCRACEQTFRVPLRQAAKREFTCPECGELTAAAAAPGRRTTCQQCGERVRVPLGAADSDAAEADAPEPADAARPVVRRTCPGCGAKAPGDKRKCPACGIDMQDALEQQRYGGVEGQPSLQGMVNYYGVLGGVLAMTGAVIWFVAGVANGVIYLYPPILFVIGVGALLKSR